MRYSRWLRSLKAFLPVCGAVLRISLSVCGRLRARRVAGGWMEAQDATASDPCWAHAWDVVWV